jgi:hypothetical protein
MNKHMNVADTVPWPVTKMNAGNANRNVERCQRCHGVVPSNAGNVDG